MSKIRITEFKIVFRTHIWFLSVLHSKRLTNAIMGAELQRDLTLNWVPCKKCVQKLRNYLIHKYIASKIQAQLASFSHMWKEALLCSQVPAPGFRLG